MATYQTQSYDPNSYSVTPPVTPVREIFQALSERTKYWEYGAEQAKTAYMQAAGLELSRADNRKILEDFMIKAEDKIKKISRSDLSLSSNVNAARNIFKPLYRDEALMADDQITKFYQQQEQLANSERMKNGGAGFSNLNLGFMREKFQDFINDSDRQNWQTHYNSRRGYTPYYDYSQELEDITKNCKPNNYTSQDLVRDTSGNPIDSLYFNYQQSKGVSKSKLHGCLEAGLSDKARQQMSIEGYMKYGKNYQALASDYLAYSDNDLNPRIEQRKALDGSIQGLMDKQKGTGLTEDEQLKLQQLQQSRTFLDNYITDQIKTRDRVAGGDYSFIEKNYENLSGALYNSQKVGQYANYFQYEDVTKKLEENNAAMLTYKVQNEANQLAARFEQQKQIEQLRLQNDIIIEGIRASGRPGSGSNTGVSTRTQIINGVPVQVPDYSALNPAATDANLVESSEEQVNASYDNAIKTKNAADQWIFDRFKDRFPAYRDPKSMIASTEFANYIKANPDDGAINQWRLESNVASGEIIRMQGIKQSVENSLRQNNPEFFNYSDVQSLAPVRVGTNLFITPQQVRDALGGIGNELVITRRQNPFAEVDISDFDVKYLGVDLSNQKVIQTLVNRVASASRTSNKQLSEKRRELFAQKRLQLEGYKDISPDNSNKDNRLKQRVAASIGVTPEQVNLRYSDLSGKVYLSLNENDKSPLPSEPLEGLRSSFKVDKEGDLYRLENVPEYSFFNSTSIYKTQLENINAMQSINQGRISRGEPVEIPIQGESDLFTGNSIPSYKIIIEKGIREGTYYYTIASKLQDGSYQKSRQSFVSPVEALKTIETLDRPNGR